MTIVKRTIDFSPAPRETQLFLGVFNRECRLEKFSSVKYHWAFILKRKSS